MDVRDSLQNLRAEAAVKGTKKSPKKIKPYPRPKSARDRILETKSNEELDGLAKDLGYGDEQDNTED